MFLTQESLAETGERPIAAPTPSEAAGAADMVNIDGETSLIVIRASGGQATAEVADDHLTAGVVVGAFEVEDLLVGTRCPTLNYLARSFETGEGEISLDHLLAWTQWQLLNVHALSSDLSLLPLAVRSFLDPLQLHQPCLESSLLLQGCFVSW